MTVLTVEDFDLEDRARALTCFATRHAEMHQTLTGAGHGWLTNDRADQALLNMIRPYVHPLLTGDLNNLNELWQALLQAVEARDTYETYGVLPDTVADLFPDEYPQERVEELLQQDVDQALAPLLFAQSSFCDECRRVKCDVIYWKPAVYGLRCEQHRLILAGQS